MLGFQPLGLEHLVEPLQEVLPAAAEGVSAVRGAQVRQKGLQTPSVRALRQWPAWTAQCGQRMHIRSSPTARLLAHVKSPDRFSASII